MVSWARLLAPVALAVSLASCGLGYGAGFDFPDAAPVPAGTTVLATDTGSDDDDPIRSRQQVIDLGTTTQTRFLASYRDAYPASEGWEESKGSSDQQLCLVNHRSGPAFVEVVEVEEYVGTRVPATPTRRLVSVSRIENPAPPVCGAASCWTSTDLVATRKDQEWGTFRGRLVMDESGPFTDQTRPVPGVVTLTGGTTIDAEVDRTGRFEIQAPPGRYVISGTSPAYMDGEGTCGDGETVSSEAGLSVDADVLCLVP